MEILWISHDAMRQNMSDFLELPVKNELVQLVLFRLKKFFKTNT